MLVLPLLRGGRIVALNCARLERRGRWRIGLAAAVAIAVAPSPASAGAWTLDPGRTQIIFTAQALDAPRRFDRQGRALRSDRFSKQEAAALAEHGLNDAVTLIAGLGFRASAFDGPAGTSRSAAGFVSAGARMRLWTQGGSVLSVEAVASASGERGLAGRPRAWDAPAEVDLRLLYGHGFALAGMPAFAEVQAGYRWRGGGSADEIRLDATLGLRPAPSVLLLLQSFNAVAVQDDRRFGGGRSRRHKLQPSVVLDLGAGWSVQFGAFASVGGRETIQERGALGAVWRRF